MRRSFLIFGLMFILLVSGVVAEDNLVAHYEFEGNVKDSAGSNDGDIYGATFVDGKFGNGMNFNGNGFVGIAVDPSLNELVDGVTVAAWIYLTSGGKDQKIFGTQDGRAGGFKLGMFTNNKLEFEIRDENNNIGLIRWVSGGTSLQTNNWYHVVGVYDKSSNSIKTYVNGELDRAMGTSKSLAPTTGSSAIGREPFQSKYFFNGRIDDLRVYNKALSAQEVQELYGPSAEEWCNDSDGGLNYDVKGDVINFEGTSTTDICVNTNQLFEFKCEDDARVSGSYPYDCSTEGKVCDGGKCVISNATNLCQSSGNVCVHPDVCAPGNEVDLSCSVDPTSAQCCTENSCGNGICEAHEADRCTIDCNQTTIRSCNDSDVTSAFPDGLNYYEAGSCSFYSSSTYSSSSGSSSSGGGGIKKDFCGDGAKVNVVGEYYCEGDITQVENYDCSLEGKVCEYGRCVDNSICTPRYLCQVEPDICPSSGIQIKECQDVDCNSGDYDEEVSCNPGECSGCEFDGACIPYGFRVQLREDETGGNALLDMYCEINGELEEQKKADSRGNSATCQNNYECESNVCSSGECIEIKNVLDETSAFRRNLFQFLCKVFNPFSDEGYNECLFKFLGDDDERSFEIVDLDNFGGIINAGEEFMVEIETSESDGTYPEPSEGFNVQVYISSRIPGEPTVFGGNAEYIGEGRWRIEGNYPEEAGIYDFQVALYCARDDAICTMIYGSGAQEELSLAIEVLVSSEGESFGLFTSSSKIYLGDSINNVRQTLTDNDLPSLLKDGENIELDGQYVDYIQTINIGSGAEFVYAQAPTSDDDPAFTIAMSTFVSEPVYTSQITFDRATDFTSFDLIGNPITLFGKEYAVGAGTTSSKLYLYESFETVKLSVGGTDPASKTVIINSISYTIEILGSSDTSAIIKVTNSIGASQSKEISEGSYENVQGIEIAVNWADEDTATNRLTAEITVGANKILLQNGNKVKIGSDEDSIDGTLVRFNGGVDSLTGFYIDVVAEDSDVDVILVGEAFVDPVFGTFGIDFSSVYYNNNRELIKIDSSGDNTATLEMTTHTGDLESITWYNADATPARLADGRIDDIIHVIEGEKINVSQYVVVGNEDEGFLLEFYQFSNDSDSTDDDIVFRDVFNKEDTYEVITGGVNKEGFGEMVVGGKVYNVRYHDESCEGCDYVTLDYPDSGVGEAIIYPSIQTSKGARVAFYEPLTIDLVNWDDNGNDLATLKFPDGGGYMDVPIPSPASGVSVTANVGPLRYSIMNGGENNPTRIYLLDVSGLAIELPAMVIFEEQDDRGNYEALIVKMEGEGNSIDGVGVKDVETTWREDNVFDNIQVESNDDLYKDVDYWGTIVTTDKSDSDQYGAEISYPGEQVYAEVYLSTRTNIGSYLELGCCYDNNEGDCIKSAPKNICEDDNGVWTEDVGCSVSYCKKGCCVLGDGAQFVTEKRCERLSLVYGLEENFRSEITTEIGCLAL
ncbi:LamG domain-containing protein [Candidatus Pacearchaeota archaeon]|nr:LamG domain-containing protein [Candidatus Pacearchaeota archaeon]